jgi:hypothetical protein
MLVSPPHQRRSGLASTPVAKSGSLGTQAPAEMKKLFESLENAPGDYFRFLCAFSAKGGLGASMCVGTTPTE